MRELPRARPGTRRLVAAGFAAAAWCGAARADEPEFRDWATEGGNHRRSAWVDVAPVHGDPVEAWSSDFGGGAALCAPVAAGGTLFVLARDAKDKESLYAVDPHSGAVLARELRASPAGPRALVAARGGVVVVVEGDRSQGYVFRGKSLKKEWTSDGLRTAYATPFRGAIVDSNGVFDPRTGRLVVDGSLGPGEPFAVTLDGDRAWVVMAKTGSHRLYQGDWVFACVREFVGVTQPIAAWKIVRADDSDVGTLDEAARRDPTFHPVPLPARLGAVWLLVGPRGAFATKGKGGAPTALLSSSLRFEGLLQLVSRPAVVGDRAYGFDTAGALVAVDSEGTSHTILEAARVPRNSPRGAVSAARNVLYAGTWALDLESRRVLWTKSPPSKVLPPAIPAADGVVVVRTEDGRLHGWVDPKGAPAAPTPGTAPGTASPGPSAGATAPAAAPVPSLPPAGDGVLLADGRHVAGDVRRIDERTLVVTPSGAAASSFPVGEVLVAISGGKVLHRADERDVAAPVRRSARFTHAGRLEQLAAFAIDQELPADAVRIAEEGARWGLPAERVAAVRNRAAGRREASSPELRRAPLAKRRAELESASRRDFGAASSWLAEAGCPTAATCLLADEAAACAGSDAAKRAGTLVPAEFPRRADPDAGGRWLAWAEHLLEAGARFLALDSPAAKDARAGVWRDAPVVVRTPNLMFVSRTEDPAVVGPCLRRGELAIGGLVRLLGEGDSPAGGRDRSPLQVRLHRNRAEYLSEAGGGHLANSLGYYSPGERVSRFHVPDADEPGQPLGRGLFEVLAHELTHQWTDERWCVSRGRTVETPAYWVVEGLARFVEDQVVDSETRVLTFDDASVTSLDTARELLRGGHLLPVPKLLVADQAWFLQLDGKPRIEVRPRRTAVGYVLSQSNVFYEQSSAVVFHLLRASGDEGRARFLEFLRKAYSGRVQPADLAILVGARSLAEYESEFRTWLASSAR